MKIQLPRPIAAYFEADRSCNSDAVAECFRPDAVVKDERKVHAGRASIRRWKADAATRFTYTVDPFAVETDEHGTTVTSHVTGNFPGSPVDLRYVFVLDGDSIAELEIVP